MNKFVGGYPMYIDKAFGNKISTVDNHTYIDFALGDTGAMAGIFLFFKFFLKKLFYSRAKVIVQHLQLKL